VLGFKTIIKPSKKKVKIHLERLAEVVRAGKSVDQKALIRSLNPIIKGWCLYYRSVCSVKTFNKTYACLHNLLRRWAQRRHPAKGKGWVVKKYWRYPEWTFGPKEGVPLRKHSDMKIRRHVKVQSGRSPFDGDWKYWASRQAYYPGVTGWLAMLLKRQEGKCAHCGMLFMPDDLLEVHHVDRDRKNNQRSNLSTLHRHCHDKAHGPGTGVNFKVSISDND
jgi:RNA-directed DNA polymerase